MCAQAGWVHADCSSGNLMLTLTNDAQLCDFGLSRRAQSPDCGTPTARVQRRAGELATNYAYCAPELHLPQGLPKSAVLDQRAVRWSRSCALHLTSEHALLTGLQVSEPQHRAVRSHLNVPAGELTARSDTYAFGIVLLELLTGREPGQSLVDDLLPVLDSASQEQLEVSCCEGQSLCLQQAWSQSEACHLHGTLTVADDCGWRRSWPVH